MRACEFVNEIAAAQKSTYADCRVVLRESIKHKVARRDCCATSACFSNNVKSHIHTACHRSCTKVFLLAAPVPANWAKYKLMLSVSQRESRRDDKSSARWNNSHANAPSCYDWRAIKHTSTKYLSQPSPHLPLPSRPLPSRSGPSKQNCIRAGVYVYTSSSTRSAATRRSDDR